MRYVFQIFEDVDADKPDASFLLPEGTTYGQVLIIGREAVASGFEWDVIELSETTPDATVEEIRTRSKGIAAEGADDDA